LYTNADAANQFLNVKAKDSLQDDDKIAKSQYDKIKSALKKLHRSGPNKKVTIFEKGK